MSLNSQATADSSEQYFAARPYYDPEYGDLLQEKVDTYYSWLTSSSLVQLWRRSYYAYYGLQQDDAGSGFGMFRIGTVIPSGLEGELVQIKVNHYHNLLDHMHVLTTQSRPALESRAVNSDSKSLAAAYLSDGVIEYFMRERKLEQDHRDAVLLAIRYGEGFIRFDWDAKAGKAYGEGPNGTLLNDGDVVSKVYNSFDVIRDVTLNKAKYATWFICKDQVNKWDVIAQHPEFRDEILKCSSDNSTNSTRRFMDPTKVITQMGSNQAGKETVLIDRFELLHEPTPACPAGRYTVFVNGGTILFDGPLPFSHMPLYRVSAGEVEGAPFGWTLAFDILGIQELIDKLYTVAASNCMSTGVQNFWQPLNNGLTKTQISGGLNLLESIARPEVLQLLQTPEEVYNFITKLEQILETLTGISSVSRGQTPENLKSGSALAFVNATSLAFSSGLQNSANQLLEDMGNGLVELLRDFAATPRIATIAGEANLPLMKSYSGADLLPIDRVTVEATAAVSKTTAGKIQIAQDLLQAGLIKTPKEYLTVVTTGKLEPLYEGEMAEILLVRAENEALRDGKSVQALRIDEHAFHISEHKAILSNPSARQDVMLVKAVLGHIQEHEQLQQMLQATDPAFLAATQQPPLPFPAPSMPPQAPQPSQLVRPGPPGIAQSQAAPNPAQSGVKPASMPALPPGAPAQAQEANQQFTANLGK